MTSRRLLRPSPQPETIKVLLDEAGNFEKCVSVESVACNSCYSFSKRLLQQCGQDVRSAESIIGSLEATVTYLPTIPDFSLSIHEPERAQLLCVRVQDRRKMRAMSVRFSFSGPADPRLLFSSKWAWF